MDWRVVQPETLEERLIHWTIVSTWGLWLIGALYIVGPVLAYGLLAIVIWRAIGGSETSLRVPHLPVAAMVWCAGMLLMLLALVIAHLDFELGLEQMVKSIIGWMKGWALLAAFVVAGAMLNIRAQVVYRATGLLAAQTLLLAPVFLLAGLLGVQSDLYVSPLKIVGGPGPEFFDVTLYSAFDTSGSLRWRFFSPWSTAAAFIAAIGFVFALHERVVTWKVIGVIGALVTCAMAGSRTALVGIPVLLLAVLTINNFRRPGLLLASAFAAVVLILVADDLMMIASDLNESFRNARAASSRVRAALASIAYHRWETEAPIFGHGIVERGPHLVQYMAIGSHHTWHGVLFVKGAVGFLALAIPMLWSTLELAIKAQTDRVARAAFAVMLAFLIFSFGDNLEIVAYQVWPGMVLVGIAHARRLRLPFRAYMASPPSRQRAYA